MKYQLLLLAIYLITIAYGEDTACESITKSSDCIGNCEWTEIKAGSCSQTTTTTCTETLIESDCIGACTFTETGGECEKQADTDAFCAAALTAATDADADAVCGDITGCEDVDGACKAIAVTDDSCAADLETAKAADNTKVCADITGCEDVSGVCKAKSVCTSNQKATCTGDARCKWKITSATCTNTCTSLSSDECNGKSDVCTWTAATNGCVTKKEDGKTPGGDDDDKTPGGDDNDKTPGGDDNDDSGSGSGSGSGTGTGTTSGSDSDSSNYVKFGNYLLVLFLFLF